MGELHLDIYVERIRREYKVELEVGAPKVSYREMRRRGSTSSTTSTRSRPAVSGQYAHIVGYFEPMTDEGAETEEKFDVRGRSRRRPHSQEFHSVDREGLPHRDWQRARRRVSGRRPEGRVNDGSYHEVDSPDSAFQTCAENCFREHFKDTKPVLLEPIMKVEIECPEHFQGPITGDLISRRGMIVNTDMRGRHHQHHRRSAAGRNLRLRHRHPRMSQGQGTFTMELAKYRPVPTTLRTKSSPSGRLSCSLLSS